jgi:hypothetical protein
MAEPQTNGHANGNGKERLGLQLGSKRVDITTNHLLSLVLVGMIGAAGYWLSGYLDAIQEHQQHHIARQEARFEAISTSVRENFERIRELVEHRMKELHAVVDQRAQTFIERQGVNLERFHAYTKEEQAWAERQTKQLLDALRWHDHNATLPVEQRVPLYDESWRQPPGKGP